MSATPQTSQNTLVIQAAGDGDLNKVIRLVEEHMYDVNQQERNHGWTPLSMAVYCGKGDVVGYLIGKNADINKTAYSKTPLFMAAALWALRVIWEFLSGAIDWVSG